MHAYQLSHFGGEGVMNMIVVNGNAILKCNYLQLDSITGGTVFCAKSGLEPALEHEDVGSLPPFIIKNKFISFK